MSRLQRVGQLSLTRKDRPTSYPRNVDVGLEINKARRPEMLCCQSFCESSWAVPATQDLGGRLRWGRRTVRHTEFEGQQWCFSSSIMA